MHAIAAYPGVRFKLRLCFREDCGVKSLDASARIATGSPIVWIVANSLQFFFFFWFSIFVQYFINMIEWREGTRS